MSPAVVLPTQGKYPKDSCSVAKPGTCTGGGGPGKPKPIAIAYWGEIVKAVLVLNKGKQATEEEITGYCHDLLASCKKPTVVEFRDSLPKNAMQKVLKTVLREEPVTTFGT